MSDQFGDLTDIQTIAICLMFVGIAWAVAWGLAKLL